MSKTIDLSSYTKLNLACGPVQRNHMNKPWLNVDLKCNFADVQMDVHTLPQEWTERFWEVRASHVLEHFYINEWPSVLSSWLRVLKPGGVLRISMPDLDKVVDALSQAGISDMKGRKLLSLDEPTPALMELYGAGYEDSDHDPRWRHRISTNATTLIDHLNTYRLEELASIPTSLDTARLHNIRDDSRNPWSMTIVGRRGERPKDMDIDPPTSSAEISNNNEDIGIVLNEYGQFLILKNKKNNQWFLPLYNTQAQKLNETSIEVSKPLDKVTLTNHNKNLHFMHLEEIPTVGSEEGVFDREFVFLEESQSLLDQTTISFLKEAIKTSEHLTERSD